MEKKGLKRRKRGGEAGVKTEMLPSEVAKTSRAKETRLVPGL
jgi:hypothetical protein